MFLQKATENFLDRANKQRARLKEITDKKNSIAKNHEEASGIHCIHELKGTLGKVYPQRTYLKKKEKMRMALSHRPDECVRIDGGEQKETK